MPLTTQDWHRRFTLQSQWTKETRKYLYDRSGTFSARRILDVGCGTGAISRELIQENGPFITGLDLNYKFLKYAEELIPSATFSLANAQRMPYFSSTFDVCLCHYLLLWVNSPASVLNEMVRVAKPGGAILILAEPDYGGRIDYPPQLQILNDWQIESLNSQGANPHIGRELRSLLNNAGLVDIEVGVIGAQWTEKIPQEQISSEWEMILSDLEYIKNHSDIFQLSEEIRNLDYEAWSKGDRVLFVPTFYAWGRVPN